MSLQLILTKLNTKKEVSLKEQETLFFYETHLNSFYSYVIYS